MNCNEVIAHVGNAQAGETLLHPNDHVNLSQSSNDTFPSALHIAAVTALHTRLEPALTEMLLCLQRLETDQPDRGQTGRTQSSGRDCPSPSARKSAAGGPCWSTPGT